MIGTNAFAAFAYFETDMNHEKPNLNASSKRKRPAWTAMTATGAIAFLLVLAPSAAAGDGSGVSFDQALERVLSYSDTLSGAKSGLESATHRASSLDYLNYPRVGIEAQGVMSEKTFRLNTSKVKDAAGTALPALNPATGAAVAAQIPDSMILGLHNSGPRAEIKAELPIYTGGKIDATQRAAMAGARQAGAELSLTEQSLRTQLVQTYFRYQLALLVRQVRTEARDGLHLHLENAQKSERAGMIAKAQMLQAQVAYDEAARNLVQTDADVHSAKVALVNLLHLGEIARADTPLFVVSGSLPPLQRFLKQAQQKHPQLARLAAMDDQAAEMVRVERSERLPQLFAFSEYDASPRNPDMTRADWAVGLGLKYELFSGIDRTEAEDAVSKRQTQVQAAIRQTRIDLDTAVTNAFNNVEAARDRFLLLDSSIASARENVRVQDASFRAGFANSVDVVDARVALTRAEVERAQTAYQFDEALALLLAASGEAERFSEYVTKADKVILQ